MSQSFNKPTNNEDQDSYDSQLNSEKIIRTNSNPENNNLSLERINIIGSSDSIRRALNSISIHARYDVPVLITGETGTGKELAARGLHYGSLRSNQPFIAVNCATLTDDLFASEVFGHKKGAFTDAKTDKKGLLSIAENGTLFLDEIDSLSLKSQASLLRFLQEAEYRPVGSEKTYKAKVRLIAASNRNLISLIESGKFRQDLYYRLYILTVHMPPLRDRRTDIPILINHFINKFSIQYKLGKKIASEDIINFLCSLNWPGNVRELENMIHRLYLTSASDTIGYDSLAINGITTEENYSVHSSDPSEEEFINKNNAISEKTHTEIATSIQNQPKDTSKEDIDNFHSHFDFSRDKRIAIEEFEKSYATKILKFTRGNITKAASLCGKDRRAFGKLLKKYEINKTSIF